jgi:AcrR family transcriptional regulator
MAETPPPVHEHRSRLLEGMAHAVAAKGYADTTIADIVREAGVSRRTFYEHFSTKAECLIALYGAASHNALGVLRQSIDPGQPWHTQVHKALTAYLGCMAQNPVLMRTLFIEILGLGPAGLQARRRVNQEIADFIQGVLASKGDATLPPELAMAIVGAINELVLQAIETDRIADLPALAGPGSELVSRLTRPPAP